MNKFKKVYCKMSFVFAVAVLIFTAAVLIIKPTYIMADEINTSEITSELDDVKSMDANDKDLADAAKNSTDGLTTMIPVHFLRQSVCFWCLQYCHLRHLYL